MGLIGIGLLTIGLIVWIQHDVDSHTERAMRLYPGDRVEASIAMLASDRTRIKDKDHTVWALGTIQDVRALPALTELYTGSECQHGRELC
ncbi:MAG: hypothetical protein CL902_02660 [Dehalococcoidia bacterium]|nr:hypothetical protein [Dehalococcoidia bacterium]